MEYRTIIVSLFFAGLSHNVLCQEVIEKQEETIAETGKEIADSTSSTLNTELNPTSEVPPTGEKTAPSTDNTPKTDSSNTGTTIQTGKEPVSAPLQLTESETTTTTANEREETPNQNFFVKAYNSFLESAFVDFIKDNHWGAFGGIGPANVHFDRTDIYQHCVCNVRFGIVADHDMDMIKENFFVEAGLEFQRKGYQRFFEEHADYLHEEYKEKTNLFYLVIPTTASYRFHFRGFEFTPMVGPYYAFAIGGRYDQKRKTTDNGQYYEQSKSYGMFGDKTNTERLYDTRRFDFGLRLAVGIEYFEGMRSSMGYDWGFVDVIKSDFRGDKYKSKNGVFYISHTYFFQ